MEQENISSYSIYNEKAKNKRKVNPLDVLFQALPEKKYDIIYADPPWHYRGKMQYDLTGMKKHNKNYQEKDIFISSASFQYPTVKLEDLKTLDVNSISADDCLLYMWTTGPQMANAIELGNAWGFEYITVGFVWDKMMHNPGHYTLSQTEFVLIFKKGRIPQPRGARNVRQFVQIPRGKHSEKPIEIAKNIEKMFPNQDKIELFARTKVEGWDVWGLEAPPK